MLARARDLNEVEEAVTGGADIVDVSLAPKERWPDLMKAIGRRAAICAPMAFQGGAFVYFDKPGAEGKVIGPVIADDEVESQTVAEMQALGYFGAVLATPPGGRLFSVLSPPDIAVFIEACRSAGLEAWIAGNLEPPDVPRLLEFSPDVLCLPFARNDEFRALIPRKNTLRAQNYDVLSARNFMRDDDETGDLVMVKDLVLPVVIGAYAHEHEKPQNVRFNVTAEVRRKSHVPQDMRDVFSYDLIIDAIRTLVEQDHIVLVETLAENIAQRILQHGDILAATVRVEKLDLGPAAVGVEITRKRAAEKAQVQQLFPVKFEAAAHRPHAKKRR
jgi:(5-formylfuran-3-yl)methyl phosphate synthase